MALALSADLLKRWRPGRVVVAPRMLTVSFLGMLMFVHQQRSRYRPADHRRGDSRNGFRPVPWLHMIGARPARMTVVDPASRCTGVALSLIF